MGIRKTTEQFISEVKLVHGDKYDYSKVEYVDNKTKVCIVCPQHGDYFQAPSNHLNNQGCPKCKNSKISISKTYTKSKFVELSNKKHNNKYSYENVVYVNTRTKVVITCPEHGDFEQYPNNHLQGHGCIMCSGHNKMTNGVFVEESKSLWGDDTFDYSKCEYCGIDKEVILICKKHNIEFKQTPRSHLNKCITCPVCYEGVYNRKPHDYWSYKRCYEEAKKYKWLSEFLKGNRKCYSASKRNGYLKDFTWLKRHYDSNENILTARKHCIYKYEFIELNSVYIGLTINLEKRHIKGHCKSGSVYNFCQEHSFQIPEPQIIEDNLSLEESKERECYWIDYYKNSGYNLLNRKKGGGVGTLCVFNRMDKIEEFITKSNKLHKEKYKYCKVEFINDRIKVCIICPTHGYFYQTPNKHLLGQGCPKCGRERTIESHIKWTYETCKLESKKYETRSTFKKHSHCAYTKSRKKGWLDEFFPKKF